MKTEVQEYIECWAELRNVKIDVKIVYDDRDCIGLQYSYTNAVGETLCFGTRVGRFGEYLSRDFLDQNLLALVSA